jgi:hypothetical protein
VCGPVIHQDLVSDAVCEEELGLVSARDNVDTNSGDQAVAYSFVAIIASIGGQLHLPRSRFRGESVGYHSEYATNCEI